MTETFPIRAQCPVCGRTSWCGRPCSQTPGAEWNGERRPDHWTAPPEFAAQFEAQAQAYKAQAEADRQRRWAEGRALPQIAAKVLDPIIGKMRKQQIKEGEGE